MAVYTQIDDEMLHGFLSDYHVGQPLSFQGIAEGVENSNYLLRTDQAHFILTLYEKRVDADDLPFFIGLMQHLADKGIPCPLPVPNKSGEMLSQLAGRPAAMVTFLDGTTAWFPNVSKCGEAGAALADLHLKSAGFHGQRDNALGPAGWETLFSDITDIADKLPAHLPSNLLSETEKYLKQIVADWPQDLPRGIIHADLFPNNALFVGDQLTGVIDFYFACRDIFAYDLAVCLNSWCFEKDNSFNITKSKALVSGYQAARPLGPDEIEALPLLCAGSALRFFLTRLYDLINTPANALVKPHDPMEYWSKLRFHLAAPSASSYGIGL